MPMTLRRILHVMESSQDKGSDQLAPVFIDAQDRIDTGNWPVPGLTMVQFRNNHVSYALTWFGIALLGVYSQQLQVSTLAPPLKSLAGIGILLLYFALLQDLIVGRMSLLGDLKHTLGLMFSGPST